ncbi:MAG TPA: flagellar biosynthesis anti-sigma factor FlgM [Rhodocyclaceae bacterium]|nr:flagellar biosynthesis anti-sigma factor FlgM [Rhodocyclaceae bacterium]
MKIDNSVKSVGGLPSVSRNGAAKPSVGQSAPADGSELELSPLSAHLQAMSAAMANTPVVDSGRVAEIKQAISEGRFQLDASKIADGLIASVRQMLSAKG